MVLQRALSSEFEGTEALLGDTLTVRRIYQPIASWMGEKNN